MNSAYAFGGFETPQSNFSRLPHQLVYSLPDITTLAELKVLLYILRHTWGYSEYGIEKRMTMDEITDGRKRKDGSRMDRGTGLSRNAAKQGVEDAVSHGYLHRRIDDSDRARIKSYYMLNICHEMTSEGQNLTPWVSESTPRSETHTLESNSLETTTPADAGTAKTKTERKSRAEVLDFPVKGLTEKILAGETTKKVAATPRARNEIWELVLEHSFGITYDPANRPAKSITGRVDGCAADLKHHGINADTLKAFYADHPRWRPNTNVPAARDKLVSAVELWQKECRPKSNIITGDWTPLHAAYQAATAAPDSERGKILSLPTARLESFLLQEDELGNTALAPHAAILATLKGKASE